MTTTFTLISDTIGLFEIKQKSHGGLIDVLF